MNKVRVGQNIKKAREKQKLTQAELAKRLDLSPIHVSHIETGKANMSIDTLYDFCQVLKVTPNDILCGEFMEASIDSMVFYERSDRLNYDDKLLLQHIFRYMEEKSR